MLSVLYAAIATEMAARNSLVVPLIGEEYLRQNDPPPKIILWPTDDTFGPVEGPGGNPRPIVTVLETTQVVIWGRTRDEVQGMRDQLVIGIHMAVKKATPGSVRAGRYVLGPGKWPRAQIVGVNGFEYRMTFDYAAAIVDRRWLPQDPPQSPDASSYTGDQPLTYIKAPVDRFSVLADVSDAGEKVDLEISKETDE